MAGFGGSSFGGTPYGLGTPPTSIVPTSPAIGKTSSTLVIARSRYINPVTKRFEWVSDGRFKGMTPNQQQVYLAVRSVFGKCVPEWQGNTISEIEDIGDDFQLQVETRLRHALSRLTSAKKITVLEILTDRNGLDDGAFIRLRWFDLAEQREYATSI